MKRIRVERRQAVGYITLARPEKKNALDRLTVDELRSAFEMLERDPEIRAILLTGDGDDFCAGADLQALEAMIDAAPDTHREDAAALGRLFLELRAMRTPVVAAVRGRALAGGAGLATACDLVIADERAQFGYPEVRIGFVPAMVMTMLRRCVGEKHAADLVLSGRTIDASEAERIGLISRVIASAGFDDAVASLMAGLAKGSGTAAAFTKRLFYALDAVDFPGGIELGIATNVEARATDDFRRGVRRFASGRREEAT